MSTPEPDTRDAPGLPFTSLVVTDPPRSNTLEECRHDSGEAVVPALQAPLRRQTSPLATERQRPATRLTRCRGPKGAAELIVMHNYEFEAGVLWGLARNPPGEGFIVFSEHDAYAVQIT